MMRMLMALSLVLTFTTGAAQEDRAVTVDLSLDAAMPGEQASLSVVLAQTGSPQLGAVHVEVVLPTKLVSFVKLSKGAAAESSKAEAKTAIVKSDSPDESILKIDISAPQPIPQGVVASLTFAVSKDAPGDSEIKLKARAVEARAVGGGTLTAKAIDGTITVLSQNSDVFACFFYMH